MLVMYIRDRSVFLQPILSKIEGVGGRGVGACSGHRGLGYPERLFRRWRLQLFITITVAMIFLYLSASTSTSGKTPPMENRSAQQGISPEEMQPGVQFQDIAEAAGVRFLHTNGASPKLYMPETMGSGGLFFDYDDDGWLDIFLVDSGSFADKELASRARSVLYRNQGDGTFRDATARSGLVNRHYGMGACAADFDNDGDRDLYVTNFGPNILFSNDGDGVFTDITETGATGSPRWSTSCAFADIDNDGDVDLYVANYVDFTRDNNIYCGDRIARERAYCHPHAYNGVPDQLFRNDGDGTFVDISREAGVANAEGKGLGVVFGDYDNDGWTDIYVANDSVPNFLYRNQGNGTFEEVGVWSGVAVNGDGRPEAGMGTDMGDYDNDGLQDIFVTNLDTETNTLYHNNGEGLFTDHTLGAGQGKPSLPYVGFGTSFLDYDNDGDLDVAVANGHILPNAGFFREGQTYAQRNLLFRNDHSGLFTEVGALSGPGLASEKISRGLAVGDIDNDGDVDLLITNNGQSADLLRNDGGNQLNSLLIRLRGTKSNRDGIGTRLRLFLEKKIQHREVRCGSSYLGQNDLRVHFGVGRASQIERLEVRWPGGMVEVFENLAVNQILTLVEGEGVVHREAFPVSKSKTATPPASRVPQ